ncbi:unnamed protein product [Lactuca virosa]|uniref:AIG1-type G domain-containing protein n=1 Tax=Lactuca virosa TaxID=75947 RepID=A0AAU9MDI0_9ASTR|nr:unnamed protein product [Lactuca virosa]
MEGCSSEGVLECTSPLTLFLVGRTGNGKSATGNSILGTNGFESRRSSSSVTSVSELRKAVLADGRVIDTPGLFDSSVDSEIISKEFVGCIDSGMDGIHAVLVVFSVCCRFSEEEKAVKSSLLALFGREVYNYIIIVFTGGDELENDGKNLDDFLCDSPEALKELLSLYEGRCVLFDNRTKNPTKRANQVQQLLSLVKIVLEKNGGQPFRNEMFSEVKIYEQDLENGEFFFVVQLLSKVEHLLEEERALRVKAQEIAKAEQKKSEEEIEKMREVLERLEFTEVQEKQMEEKEPKQEKKEERKPKMKKKPKMKRLSELLETLEPTEVQKIESEQQELKPIMEKLSEVLKRLELTDVQEKQIEQQESKQGKKEETKPKTEKETKDEKVE